MQNSWDRGILTSMDLRRTEGRIIYIGIVLFLVLLAFTTVFPFVFSLTAGLKTSVEYARSGINLFPAVPQWQNYEVVFDRINIPRTFANTMIIAVGELTMQLTVSTLAAYSLSRLKPRGWRVIMVAFMATIMIPGIAYFVPLYVNVVRLGLINSYFGLWLPAGVNAFVILLLKNFYDSLPQELFDAAKIDGASSLRILWSVALPLARPIYIVLIITGFLGSWNSYLWPMLVLRTATDMHPVSVAIQGLTQSFPINIRLAAYTVAAVPPLLVAILTQRYLRRGLSLGIH
jgi:multiple sugar transport system permease protein